MLLKMAFRNLARNRRRTLITMSAIALGMALMDVTICMQHGSYQDAIRRGVGALAGHVVVQAEGYEESGERDLMVNNSTEISAQLQAIDPEGLVIRRTFMGGLITSPSGSAPVGVSASIGAPGGCDHHEAETDSDRAAWRGRELAGDYDHNEAEWMCLGLLRLAGHSQAFCKHNTHTPLQLYAYSI